MSDRNVCLTLRHRPLSEPCPDEDAPNLQAAPDGYWSTEIDPFANPMTLAAATDALYAAFADLPKPRRIDSCPCCVTEEECETMLAKPLRELTWRNLVSNATAARPKEGYVPELLYFLPRIMEIAATDPDWWPDPYMTCIPIGQTDPALWTPGRRQAMRDFFHAVITHFLSTEEESIDQVDDWLCAIACINFDVRPLLDLIARSEEHIIGYYNCNASTLSSKNRLSNSFWDRPNEGHDQIVAWFTNPPASEVIHRAYGVVFIHPSQ